MSSVLKDRRGEGYIDMAISILVIMMVLVVAMNVFSFLVIKQNMAYFAREMIDAATVSGSTEVNSRYTELSEETGLNPSCAWEADYYNTAEKTVQYGDTIQVTLTYHTYVKGFGVFQIPVTLTASSSGLSQTYFK